jgi:hypothetical protein
MNSDGTAREWRSGRDICALTYGHVCQTFDPAAISAAAGAIALTSGTLYLMAGYLREGDTVTNLGFLSGSVAAASPTNWWLSIYSNALALLAATADRTTDAVAANSMITKPLSAPYISPSDQQVYLGMVFNAATAPSVLKNAQVIPTAAQLLTPHMGATSTTGITTALPNPAGALTAAAYRLFMFGT